MITPVILCGGSGTRLWPLSRKSYPKQFSALLGSESLFQNTARRVSGTSFSAPMIVTADAFRFIVTEQLSALNIEPMAVLIEPSARDTAAAVLAAALDLQQTNPDGMMLVAPSDHDMPDADQFKRAIEAALPAALEGKFVTFGIAPDRPETGYGYLEVATAHGAHLDVIDLKGFVEKPDLMTAKTFLKEGRYLWNSGIFLFSVAAIIEAFETYAPDMMAPVKSAILMSKPDMGFTRLDPSSWSEIDPISLDFAIMEKATNLSVVPYSGKWSDLGDWGAVWRQTEDNGLSLSGDATAIDCKNTLLRSEADGQIIVGVGLEDIVAIAMPDAVLIAHKDRTQEVKQAVVALTSKQAEEFPKDHRPWGWFESIALGDRFQVKRIVVHPGASLSLQSHHHRSEHWIVVEGTARVTIDDETKLVSENQSVYIPLGAVHRMENPGKLPMVLIEVQTGAYLGEDDIIRYEDEYARG